jgi:hypothetical protein
VDQKEIALKEIAKIMLMSQGYLTHSETMTKSHIYRYLESTKQLPPFIKQNASLSMLLTALHPLVLQFCQELLPVSRLALTLQLDVYK